MRHTTFCFALLVLGHALAARAEASLTPKLTFIETYGYRATIEATCTVDRIKGKANAPSKDGDMHVAVRCPG